MRRIFTICPYCGCGCGLYLTVKNGCVTGSYPSANHPISRSSLCAKGWHCYEFIHHPERLKSPLVKKGSGFVEVNWQEALDLVAKRLRQIQNNFGSQALGFLSSAKATNEENYLMMKLARAVFKSNNIDNCARLCHAPTIKGLSACFGSGAMTNSINEFREAEVILVTGSDTTEQHPLIGSRIINAVKKGTKLIVVDPRRSQLAQFAHYYLRPKPGTDVAWINGMMNLIIQEGWQDKKFIEERTEGFIRLQEVIQDYQPDYVEGITGIKKELLIEATRLYAQAGKAMIVYSMGITQHTTGVDNVVSLANLTMLTGHIGKEASGVNPLRGQNNVQGACDMGALPDVFTGYQPVTNDSVRKKFERAWGVGGLFQRVGLTVTEIIQAAKKGEIRGLYIMGENPLLSNPDITQVRRALEAVDFLVVQDIFLSETAELADVVLPGVSFAEKEGTFTNTERRVQRINKAIEPLEQARPDWQIICEIANRCGYKMHYSSPAQIFDEITCVTSIYGGMDYQRLLPWGLQWPCFCKEDEGTIYLHKDRFSKGKGAFIPAIYQIPDELTDEEYNFILTTGRISSHWHTGTMSRRSLTLERENPQGYAEINPQDAHQMHIFNQDKIRIISRRVSIQMQARITDKVAPGVIFTPFHFKESPANLLTNPAVDEQSKIPEYKVCAVRIERCN